MSSSYLPSPFRRQNAIGTLTQLLSVAEKSDSSSVCYGTMGRNSTSLWITGNISEECCDRMAPRTSGSNLSRSFVQAEEEIKEAEKEMAYNEQMVEEEEDEEKEEGKNALRHTLEAMSLNKSQVDISPVTFSSHLSTTACNWDPDRTTSHDVM